MKLQVEHADQPCRRKTLVPDSSPLLLSGQSDCMELAEVKLHGGKNASFAILDRERGNKHFFSCRGGVLALQESCLRREVHKLVQRRPEHRDHTLSGCFCALPLQ